MARKDKPLKLRPVEDSSEDPAPAIRLENRDTLEQAKGRNPIRVEPAEESPGFSWRLDLPDRGEAELRTHQPGIEALIEPESSAPELVEENWGAAAVRRHPVPWGWFALIGLAIVGAVLWSLSRVGQADVQVEQIREATESALIDEQREEQEAEELIERIDRTLRDLANVTSVGELARLVRQPERVAPLMRQYYGDRPVYLGRLRSIRMLQPLTLGYHGNFWAASVVMGDDEARSLILEIAESGEPRVDWETFVCYQPMKWDDFALQRPVGTSLDFRVHAEVDNFFSHEFADSDQWVCFRLTALASEEPLFGYARVGSAEAAEMHALVESVQGGSVSVILRLSIPEGLQSRRGVVIEKVLNPRWIYLDPPDTGS